MHSYSLTLGPAMRDGEGAARSHTSRGCAAHAVQPLRPGGLTGGAMVRRAYRQRSLVEVLLPDADKLWDSTLRQIDALLDDDVLVDRVAEALAQRHPQSRRRGRLGRPPPWFCGCWSSSISTTGASMSASGRCGAAWCTAPSAESTASACRTRRR